jgi:hypothetical protein
MFYIFSNQGWLENMVGKTLSDIGKANEGAKKDIMDAKNTNVLVREK